MSSKDYKESFLGIPLPGPTPHPHYQSDDVAEHEKLLAHDSEDTIMLLDSKKNTFYLDIYRKENIGLIISYFGVGFAIYFTSTPVYYYMIDSLDASSTQTSVLSTLQSLPWSFKILYGLLSDSLPISGYRRKPYFLIGWIVYLLSNIILICMVTPSIIETIVWNFFMMCGLLLADVCTDTMFVERAKLETEVARGTFQTIGYIARSVGSVLGAVLGAVLYNKSSWGWGLTIWQIYLINGFFPFVLIGVSFYHLVELAPSEIDIPFVIKIKQVWATMQMKAVWRPISFIYIYNVFQVSNGAWTNYLVESLDFSDFELGCLTIAGTLMIFAGLLAYKEYFFNTGWQSIYIFTTILGVFFSLLQLLLIYQVNQLMGIPNIVFALGDTTFAQFVVSIQFMPSCIMYVTMCPDGSEGTTYALLTTISNLASTVASDISSWLTEIWNVSNTTLAAGHYSGFIKLTILTSCLQFVPIFLVFLLPNTKEEQKKLRDEGASSWWGGFILALVLLSSLIFTVFLNIYLLA